MFGLFGTPTVTDPQLGRLQRRGGAWRGSIALAGRDDLPLALPGGRSGPDAAALALAHTLPGSFEALRPAIASALREHAEPYEEAAAGADPAGGTGATRGGDADAHWARAQPVQVAVVTLEGEAVIELGLAVDWDEEHTLGARFVPGRLIELCGSIVAS